MENVLTLWARTVVSTLAALGVTDIVASPGSRSTPLLCAALEEPSVRCHLVLDERTAAFFALGMARVSAAPPVLLCTSGSAAAHYLPAVLEASHSGLALVVLTADRPTELHACAAAQTADHAAFFRGHVREELDLGEPVATREAFLSVRRKIAQAFAAATAGPSGGPVHVNVPVRKPLEPHVAAPGSPEEAFEKQVAAWTSGSPVRVPTGASVAAAESLAPVAEFLRRFERGVIVAGPCADPGIARSLERLGVALSFPLLAETSSQARYGPAIEGLVRAPLFEIAWASAAGRRKLVPDVAIVVGQPPTSSAWGRVAESGVPQVCIASQGWTDPHSEAAWMCQGPVRATVDALTLAVGERLPSNEPWLRAWEDADRACSEAVREELALWPDGSEGQALRLLAERVPDDAVLFVGNSLPIREIDVFGVPRETGPLVLSQRGLNGIDGAISGAAGTALASGRRVVAVLGDVTFLHDAGGLALAARLKTPLVLVLVNNGGGRIFEFLPIAKQRSDLEPWTMPHRAKFAELVQSYDVAHVLVREPNAFGDALARALEAPHATCIEVLIRPHAAREEQAAVRQRLAARLVALLGA